MNKRFTAFSGALLMVFATTGCATENAGAGNSTETDAAQSIVLYSGRSEELVAPLLEMFTAETGITVTARYGESAEMAAAILEEGDNVQADLFFAQDAGALGAVANQTSVQKLPSELLELVPEEYRAADGSWIGVSGRGRVFSYNPELVPTLPTSVLELADPGWKGRIGIAPTNASFQSFVTAMRVVEGDEVTLKFLTGLKENAVTFEKNSQILDAVESGELAAGLINHYYWFEKANEIGADAMTSKMAWFDSGDSGNLVNVAGVSVLSENPAALKFATWLLSESAQKYFLETTFEYSLTSDVPPSTTLPKLSEIAGPEIDLSDLSTLQDTLDLLSESGLI